MRYLIPLIALCFAVPAQAAEVKTILAAGCFWSMEKNFDHAPGVTNVVAGYAGGSLDHPTYENYHDTDNGAVPHVEAVEVTYDDTKTTYAQLLNYYFHHIDPTSGNGQFCDFGPGYKPVIFVADDAQKKIAQDLKAETARELGKDVAVEIRSNGVFWPAEGYHQDYYKKNPESYERYSQGCGRERKLKDVWGSKAGQ